MYLLVLLLLLLIFGMLAHRVWLLFFATPKSEFTLKEVKSTVKKLNIPLDDFSIHDLKRGMDEELEHGLINPDTNITNDDPVITAKIAWAHLNKNYQRY